MDWLRVALPVLFGGTVIISVLAQRRLPARSAAAVWLAGLRVAVMPIVMILAGIALLSASTLLGATIILGGLVFFAVWAISTERSLSKVRAAQTDSQVGAALDEAYVDMTVLWAALLLLGGFVAVGLLVVALVATR